MAHWTAPEARGARFSESLATLIGAAAIAFGALRCYGPSAEAADFHRWTAAEPPHFVLPDSLGANVALDADHAAVTIVHFFATWCEPCRDELPALNRLSARGGTAIRVLAISVAEPDTRVRRFLETMPLNFPVLLDPARITASAWNVSTLPTSVVLDSHFKARFVVETDFAWDAIDPRKLIEENSAGDRLRGSLNHKNLSGPT